MTFPTVNVPPTQPFSPVQITTDSTAPSQASGQSAFLNPSTPFAQVFGNWGFALGDVDAEKVRVTACDAAGKQVPVSFQGSFNFCQGTPLPSACGGQNETDQPSWDPASSFLVGNVADTNGAAGRHPARPAGRDPGVRGHVEEHRLISGAEHGTITSHANCTVTYTPNPGFTGNDSFTLRIETADGQILVRSFDVKVARTLPATGLPGGLPAEVAAALALLGAGAVLTAATRKARKA
ncbi:Ig-like domain-containing protein [Catenulispora rubra]|uniref:Ig-like domain-containing protein n=1 Tax=Catenulispora rubra TaxID=280293 RepID=UPI0018924A87|nr:Ig-like domain-containing protein [Catenulispora rubra]